jgi:Protein of unknown function (DUF1501)
MAYDWKTEIPGITSRHSDKCPIGDGRECTCGPKGFRASIRDRYGNRSVTSPTFPTLLEALIWQRDQVASTPSAPAADWSTRPGGPEPAADRTRVGALIVDFLQAAAVGTASDSHGQRYGPEGLGALRGALTYVDSEFGRMPADEMRRDHVQGLVHQLRGSGVDGTRILAVVDALNALYSYAIRHDVVGFSPVVELDLLGSETGLPYLPTQTPPSFPSANGSWASPVAPPGPSANGSWPLAVPQMPWEPTGHSGQWAGATAAQFGNAAPADFRPADQSASSGYTSGGFPPQSPTPPPGTNGTGSGFYSGSFATPGSVPDPNYTGTGSGFFSGPFAAPGQGPDANYDATMQERWLWWTVRIIVIVFVLIALVLVAESV